jgi:dipeptidyl aminopeptidase/acylaminoacyl peptidase
VKGNYDLLAIDPDTLERETIASRPWDEANGQWSPDGRQVAYTVNLDGNLVLHVQDLESGQSRPVSPSRGVSGHIFLRGHGGDYRWNGRGGQIVYSYSGSAQPDSVWIVDDSGGEPRALYAPMPEGIERGDLVEPEMVHYTSFDGRRISAFLYRPDFQATTGRALVFPHGGPTGQSMNDWRPEVQFLVSRGFAVLAPNFRGSTGYGTEFQWLNRNDWAGGDLRDVVAGRDWLVSNGIGREIGIIGGSYGGYLTLSAITQYPDKWQAAVSFCGFANLLTAYESARPDMRAFQERNIGTPEQNPEFYWERSPVNHVDRIQCPLLLIQGERDPRVLKEETDQMAEALRDAGKEFEAVLYPDEGHRLVRLEHTVDAYDRVARFFDIHLGSTRG